MGEPLVPPRAPSSRAAHRWTRSWPPGRQSRPPAATAGAPITVQSGSRVNVIRRRVCALSLVGLVLIATGCGGTEDPTQQYARDAVEAHLAHDAAYDLGHVHCTGNPRPWFVEQQTTESICAVRRAAGGCDWFHVELVPVGPRVATRVRLQSENAGCSPA